jgi:hypothetical protein
MNAAPIYLLRGDEPDGPHDYDDIVTMLDKKEIEPEILSSVEGMLGWRSVPETQMWSQAKFLQAVLPEATDIRSRLAKNKLDVRYARDEIRRALMHKNILTADIDILGDVLQVSGYLERLHSQYSHRDQYWMPDGFVYHPALELEISKKQKFPRDWMAAWQQSGGKIYAGRMIARIDDPVWSAVSDFGFPFPPFSFDWLTWIHGVSSTEAVTLGVVDLVRDICLPEIPKLKFAGL